MKYSNDPAVTPPAVMKNKKSEFTELLVQRIENAFIENNDALYVLKKRDHPKAFHYIDPPYPGADNGHYGGYSWEEYEKLIVECEKLKGKFLLSNYNSPLLDGYIEKNGWLKKEFVMSNPGMRKNDRKKTEILVMNYIPSGNIELPFNN